jgi:hypothetical protein
MPNESELLLSPPCEAVEKEEEEEWFLLLKSKVSLEPCPAESSFIV